MNEFLKLLKENILTAIPIAIGVVGLIFGLWRLILYTIKTINDFKNFKNSKAKFSIYLEDGYRLHINNEKIFMLFNVRITNNSSSKNSLISIVEVEYSGNLVKIKHNAELFKEIPLKNLTGLSTSIKLDEKEIKSGWLIFNYPKSLENKLIELIRVKVEDGNGQKAEVSSVIIKDVVHETEESIF